MPLIVTQQGGHTVTVERRSTVAVERRSIGTLATAEVAAVATVVDRPSTIAVVSPGPQGAKGAPGGTSEVYTASEALGGHRLVRSTGNGSCGYVDASNEAHGDDTLGLTLNAASLGADVDVQRTGAVVFGSWSWTPELPVFAASNGLMTQTPPTSGVSQIVGFAEDATTLHLRIEPPIYLD